jgi:hypothetical protein
MGTSNKAKLKTKYIAYYEDVPVQKYAAMAIGRDEDTIIRWRKQDTKFAESIQRAKADWVRKRVLETKSEFALERLEKSIFSNNSYDINLQETQTVDLSSLDPNYPENKVLVDNVIDILMKITKRTI